MEEGVSEQENSSAPPPPSEGKIFAIDQDPDINVIVTVTVSTPHNMITKSIKGDLTLEQLVDYLGANATPNDMILVESGFPASGVLV